MAVNWNAGLVNSGLGAIEAFNAGRNARIQENALRRQEADYQRQQQARAEASRQLSAGDTRTAQQTAIAGGDFDFAKAIGSYSDDQRKQLDAEAESLGRFAVGLKNAPVEQRKQAFVQSVGALRGMFSPEEIRQRYDELEANGWSDAALDGYVSQAITVKNALDQATKANEQYTLAPGSARYDARGNLIRQQPFAPQLRSVGAGESLVEIQPGGGDPASTGPLSVDSLLPHIVAQESGGNYAARNQSTGALGAYQVMPATAQTLAGRLGLPWRQDLMTSDSPEGRAYQDQIGRAAVSEAVDASGGDPRTAALYYHGGSDRSKWGPRTQKYADEVVGRLGGGSRVVAQGTPKPQWTTLSADEARSRGLPAGPVYQQGPNGEIKSVGGTAQAGGSGLTKTQEGVIRTKLRSIQSIRSQLGRVKAAMRDLEKKGWTGSLGGLVPGVFDDESDRFDKAVAGLAPLIRQLTRVPGEGASSDYESALANAALPSRRSTEAGRKETVMGIEDLLNNTESGYKELLGGQTSPAKSSGGWGTARKVR